MATVLLIDDDPDFLKLGEAQLSARGHTVMPVASAVDALKLTQGKEVDFIISDVMMDDVDGEQFLDEMNRRGGVASVPILMISSRKDLVQSVRMIAKGALDLARKPIDWDRIDGMIKRTRVPQAAKLAAAPARAATAAKKPKVLVVEDSSTQRALWRLTLSEQHVDLQIVPDGTEALRALEASTPTLLITDVDLGDISGYDVATAARRAAPNLPVIIISSRVKTGLAPEVELPGSADQTFCFNKGDRADALLRAGRILGLPPVA